jgi:hypothetical protein
MQIKTTIVMHACGQFSSSSCERKIFGESLLIQRTSTIGIYSDFLPLNPSFEDIEYVIYTNGEHVTCALLLINMPTFSEFVIEQLITRGLAFLP